jgi:hypothetical protein
MTVGELKYALLAFDDDILVVMASDAEGNSVNEAWRLYHEDAYDDGYDIEIQHPDDLAEQIAAVIEDGNAEDHDEAKTYLGLTRVAYLVPVG